MESLPLRVGANAHKMLLCWRSSMKNLFPMKHLFSFGLKKKLNRGADGMMLEKLSLSNKTQLPTYVGFRPSIKADKPPNASLVENIFSSPFNSEESPSCKGDDAVLMRS